MFEKVNFSFSGNLSCVIYLVSVTPMERRFNISSFCNRSFQSSLIWFIFMTCISKQSETQNLILHEVVVVMDVDMAVVLVRGPIGTSATMKILMAIEKYLLLRVRLKRLMGNLLKGVVATVDLAVHSVVPDEVVSAMETLEKENGTTLVGLLSAVVGLDVGMYEPGASQIVSLLLSMLENGIMSHIVFLFFFFAETS